MPEVTLSLPAALGFLALFVTIGAVLVFFTLRGTGKVVDPTATPTETVTPTITLTPTMTLTPTLAPTTTPLPPIEYEVKAGDTCNGIAYFYHVSAESIITLNNLSLDCILTQGNKILVPQPTPTAEPQATTTLSAVQATDDNCEKYDYTVAAGDTLSGIALNFNVTADSIKEYNGIINDIVIPGTTLKIPLCARKTIDGATPTPTTPPPYPSPNLLLPVEGATFASGDIVTLQWASVGTLRSNEAYAVTVQDATHEQVTGQQRRITEYVTDTKFTLPETFRPTDNQPHLLYWWVLPVRQTGTADDGKPIYDQGGSMSEKRGLIWTGQTVQVTPTP
ncbi:MAG TPA: LysM peptidoglycan-binding domain-containing protein [Anaerolineaceae bacterium]|nr:LysM peptidoglycan-binding domain-containing protein [Anaerolineaceae bacterium]